MRWTSFSVDVEVYLYQVFVYASFCQDDLYLSAYDKLAALLYCFIGNYLHKYFDVFVHIHYFSLLDANGSTKWSIMLNSKFLWKIS